MISNPLFLVLEHGSVFPTLEEPVDLDRMIVENHVFI